MTRTVLPAPPVDEATRSTRARVPLTDQPGLFGRLLRWYSNRAYGRMLDNGLALAHQRRVLLAVAMFERRVAKFSALDPMLKTLATTAVSVQIECSWCLDFGYYQAHHDGVDLDKVVAVPHWRDADIYSELERAVLEYAEAATATPPTVTDAQADYLRAALGNAALVELTAMIAIENQRSRINSTLGLASQGFSESCRVPAR